jgi:uncharacterized protein (UPF0303 family)
VSTATNESADAHHALEAEIVQLGDEAAALQWPAFGLDQAWRLGNLLREAALARGAALAIEVRWLRETVFSCLMPGATPENLDWARRKRNTVELTHRSSYVTGRALALEGSSLALKMGLSLRDHAEHGGSVPIVVVGQGCLGVATVSGLPQREDHELVVQTMKTLLREAS